MLQQLRRWGHQSKLVPSVLNLSSLWLSHHREARSLAGDMLSMYLPEALLSAVVCWARCDLQNEDWGRGRLQQALAKALAEGQR